MVGAHHLNRTFRSFIPGKFLVNDPVFVGVEIFGGIIIVFAGGRSSRLIRAVLGSEFLRVNRKNVG